MSQILTVVGIVIVIVVVIVVVVGVVIFPARTNAGFTLGAPVTGA